MKRPLYRKQNRNWRIPLFALGLAALIVGPMLIAGLVAGIPALTVTSLLFLVGFPTVFVLVELAPAGSRDKPSRFGKGFYTASTLPFQPKLARIERDLPSSSLRARGLMVKNVLQAPAVISLNDESITFAPAVGKPFTAQLDRIQEVVESPIFNGSRAPGQTGFILKAAGFWRLGFAVYDDPQPWREGLCGPKTPDDTASEAATVEAPE